MTSSVSAASGPEWLTFRMQSYHQYLYTIRRWRDHLAEIYQRPPTSKTEHGIRAIMEPEDEQRTDEYLDAVQTALARVELVAGRHAVAEARRRYEEIRTLASNAYGGSRHADYGGRGRQISKVGMDELVSRFRHDLGVEQLD